MTLGGIVNAASYELDIVGTGNFTATNAGNDFGTVTITNAGNVSIYDTNDISLGTSTLNGNLSVTAGGNINFNGVNTGTGTIYAQTQNSGTGNISVSGVLQNTNTGTSAVILDRQTAMFSS